MKGDFFSDLAVGRSAEIAIIQKLEKIGHSVTDVSLDKEYQHISIDLLIEKNDQQTSLEVKNDLRSEQTNNVFLETISRNKKGWFSKSQASYVAFCQMGRGFAHIVALDELREKVKHTCYHSKWNTQGTACGIVFPVDQLQEMESYHRLQIMEEKDNVLE